WRDEQDLCPRQRIDPFGGIQPRDREKQRRLAAGSPDRFRSKYLDLLVRQIGDNIVIALIVFEEIDNARAGESVVHDITCGGAEARSLSRRGDVTDAA